MLQVHGASDSGHEGMAFCSQEVLALRAEWEHMSTILKERFEILHLYTYQLHRGASGA